MYLVDNGAERCIRWRNTGAADLRTIWEMSSVGHWWENLFLTSELPENTDYIPRNFSPGKFVVGNHRLLESFRDNDFAAMDPSYSEYN